MNVTCGKIHKTFVNWDGQKKVKNKQELRGAKGGKIFCRGRFIHENYIDWLICYWKLLEVKLPYEPVCPSACPSVVGRSSVRPSVGWPVCLLWFPYKRAGGYSSMLLSESVSDWGKGWFYTYKYELWSVFVRCCYGTKQFNLIRGSFQMIWNDY